ncbi:MAG: threonine/serine exporter family protein, partial [Candidatus Polarisedimenticolia bacterium]
LVAPVCFGLLLKARFRDLGWVLLGSVAAYGGTRLGAAAVGPQLGAFAGTFVLGMASNLFARHSNRPAALTYVPGVMLLVPGSIGLRGVTDFLAHNVSRGIEAGFNAVLVAVALASGMLLATVVVPARRAI